MSEIKHDSEMKEKNEGHELQEQEKGLDQPSDLLSLPKSEIFKILNESSHDASINKNPPPIFKRQPSSVFEGTGLCLRYCLKQGVHTVVFAGYR